MGALLGASPPGAAWRPGFPFTNQTWLGCRSMLDEIAVLNRTQLMAAAANPMGPSACLSLPQFPRDMP